MSVTVRRRAELSAFRISPQDTNYMVPLFDPLSEPKVSFTAIVEIFEPKGKTPPNTHAIAHEMFFVLAGHGRAFANGQAVDLAPGDTICLDPNVEHVIENLGPGKLYTLTIMVPNEGFAELIRAGTPVTLDAEDHAILARLPVAS